MLSAWNMSFRKIFNCICAEGICSMQVFMLGICGFSVVPIII